jgi:hypothetical protein
MLLVFLLHASNANSGSDVDDIFGSQRNRIINALAAFAYTVAMTLVKRISIG